MLASVCKVDCSWPDVDRSSSKLVLIPSLATSAWIPSHKLEIFSSLLLGLLVGALEVAAPAPRSSYRLLLLGD